MSDRLGEEALEYHRLPPAGKLAVVATKPLATQRDLSLAYSPGVAAACELIVARPGHGGRDHRPRQPGRRWSPTAPPCWAWVRSAPLASKPVMEGKAVLFKKFAGIDSFDIEIDELDPDKLVEIVAALEPTFGAINLEDIKAPECFIVEQQAARADEDPGLPRRPARHRDHRRRRDPQRAVPGRQADRGVHGWWPAAPGRRRWPASTCWSSLGMPLENILVTDIDGVVYEGRTDADGSVEGAATREPPACARWPRRSRVRTSSSACPPPACSSRRWWPRWPPSR